MTRKKVQIPTWFKGFLLGSLTASIFTWLVTASTKTNPTSNGTQDQPIDQKNNNIKNKSSDKDTSEGPVKPTDENDENDSNHSLIKGNRNTKGELIYHVPGGQFYDVTEAIELFNSEEEAEMAGYRKSAR